ncbi:hypothetical protein J3U99_11755 [Brucella pituitosa]|uniref:Uncharacterized protein n=1 Tax=Brucella pituitosa TaxID=571256 RepID=A0A643F0P7_9HYPH|nr:hypothetical protein [Brucella pituitosa]KAB0571051.1 hypothetical protein F7Q93_13865 [Brucella pituitosa]MCK4205441.1 hypothetical protein [Brucella pituitosa]
MTARAVLEGRYILAKYGFRHVGSEWVEIKNSLCKSLNNEYFKIQSADYDSACAIIDSDDNRALKAISELHSLVDFEYRECEEGRIPFGRALLCHLGSWAGVFDLNDEGSVRLLLGD